MQGLGASARDCREYSLLRGIQSCIRRNQAVPDGLEGEFHRALEAQNLGIEPQGFLCPLDANIRLPNRMQRDMQATVFATGGAFVPSQLVMPVIEILRNFLILNKVGVRVMAGLVGNILLPRQEAAATAYAVPEIGPLSDSGQILGQLAMAPHRVGATQTYSKQFVMQSTPDAEAFLRDDLFKVIALQHDRLGINGQGAGSEPLGVMNTPGINSILFGGTATYQQIVNMATAIRTMNVREPLAYISTPTSRGRLQTVPELLLGATILGGAQNALWKPSIDPTESRVNGWPAYDTNQIPNNQMLCGAFEHLVQGIWGGLDVVVDIFTKAKQAETVITINTWIDWAVRHAQAFTVSADSAAQ
jgi:HK97 family phage major capsid protein